MPEQAISDDPVVIVVDVMEFRRALMVHFLKDWAAQAKLEILSLAPARAHEVLRDGVPCRMIILNAGGGSRSSLETLAEVMVLRTLAPSASLVVVADDEIRDDVIAIMKSGAEGYLSNQSPPELALRALSFVLDGGTYFPRSVVAPNSRSEAAAAGSEVELGGAGADEDAAGADGSPPTPMFEFSERQKAILWGLCRGEPNKNIGRLLNLPESTVKVHVREIMRKLSVSNRTQVAVAVSRMGGEFAGRLDQRSDRPHTEWFAVRSPHAPTGSPQLAPDVPAPGATNGVDPSLHQSTSLGNVSVGACESGDVKSSVVVRKPGRSFSK
jgi:DNA-binding NarL/FixJ family response regulator